MSNRGFLLDTNAISELGKRNPQDAVLRFFAGIDGRHTYLSMITYGELRRGALLADRKGLPYSAKLRAWLETTLTEFGSRLIPVDQPVAEVWAQFSMDRTRPMADTLIAATAYMHELTLVTRNGIDFAGLPISILNPWDAP